MMRANPWDPLAEKVAWLIGTRVAKAILASGLASHIDRPDIWMQAIRSNLTKLLCHGGRPHMGPGFRRRHLVANLVAHAVASPTAFPSLLFSAS